MPRKPKTSTSGALLAPIPSEILDQFVRQGPLTPEELDEAVRRFKSLEISLENARFPHSHNRSSSFQMRKEGRRTNATTSTTSHT